VQGIEGTASRRNAELRCKAADHLVERYGEWALPVISNAADATRRSDSPSRRLIASDTSTIWAAS
jgi:hypothetical protein